MDAGGFSGALGLALGLALSLPGLAQEPPPAPQPSPAQESAGAPAAVPAATPNASQAANPAPDAGQQPAQQPTQQPAATPETQQPGASQAPAAAPLQNQPATAPSEHAPATVPAAAVAPAPAHKRRSAAGHEPAQAGMTEEELKRMLVGKPLFLRGGYLDNTLTFSERGALIGHSPQGSYTLSAIQIDRVRLTRHKVELEGIRYGLHFLGGMPYEDPTQATDRVRITPKKKMVKITIDRELVETPKKKKGDEKARERKGAAEASAPQAAPEPAELSEAEETKAEMAATPAYERPADPDSVTTTNSPAHAKELLQQTLDRVFATGLDDRMIGAMPGFWKLYYQAAAAKTDYRPTDPSVLRQTSVDKKAILISKAEPDSNDFAQANGVAGPALFHAVIGADGKAGVIAVARPIGFGLDENAVEAIRKATFEPAVKDGKPVAVLLDLVVQFRIFSKRTAATGNPEAADKLAGPQLPGPYSVAHP
jgi:outer membrane biosynthesis protein TonB